MGVENFRLEFWLLNCIFFANLSTLKMSEAQDAFIIFDEAYEGADVDAFYLGDILRALGCNVTNAAVAGHGGTTELGVKRIAFADFGPILAAVKADTSSTGCKEDYVEGLKVFDKDASGKVPLPEIKNVLSSLGEKLDGSEADKLCELLDIKADEEDMVGYMSSLTSSSPPPLKSLLIDQRKTKPQECRITDQRTKSTSQNSCLIAIFFVDEC